MSLPEERHAKIVQALEARELLHVQDVVRLTGASLATTRRDFEALAQSGRARRVRGGLKRVQGGNIAPFRLREMHMAVEKEAIARAAAARLQPGDVVIIDGGTTTAHLAHHLPDVPLSVITNSLRLASLLDQRPARRSRLEVVLTGGTLFPGASLLVGPAVLSSLRHYHARWAFLSVAGLTPQGAFNNNELVVEAQQQMLRSAEQTVVLADHTKIGSRALCRLCDLEDVQVICDASPDEQTLAGEVAASAGQYEQATSASEWPGQCAASETAS